MKLFWFRRDLRLADNAGLYRALSTDMDQRVQPIFIFDHNILQAINNPEDKRVPFLHQTILELKKELQALGSDLWVFYGKPDQIFTQLLKQHKVHSVYCNHDYEPAALKRDSEIGSLCHGQNIDFQSFKDQVIFEQSEILSGTMNPYTVYTPYKKKWLETVNESYLKTYPVENHFKNLNKDSKIPNTVPSLKEMGFEDISKKIPDLYPSLLPDHDLIKTYDQTRDIPAILGTSRLGLHLRFGTLSPRELVALAKKTNAVWLSELIWREFFMQILFHFPHVEKKSFRPAYDKIEWLDSKSDFERWSNGETGYPLVDAGMRELNATGFMHNRVRMVTASFLTKHLLQYWLKGERYFARELLDYDLAANNGNWQWAAGTGCDAAPYFRVFNPTAQAEKFDPKMEYVKKWVPEFGTAKYPSPMVDHKMARERALAAFGKALKGPKL